MFKWWSLVYWEHLHYCKCEHEQQSHIRFINIAPISWRIVYSQTRRVQSLQQPCLNHTLPQLTWTWRAARRRDSPQLRNLCQTLLSSITRCFFLCRDAHLSARTGSKRSGLDNHRAVFRSPPCPHHHLSWSCKARAPCQGGGLFSRTHGSAAPDPNKEPIHAFAHLLCSSIYLWGRTLSPAGTTDVLEKQRRAEKKSSLSRCEW